MNPRMYIELRKALSKACSCLCGATLTEDEAKPLREFQSEIDMKLTATKEWYDKEEKEYKKKHGELP